MELLSLSVVFERHFFFFTKTVKMLWQGGLYEMETELDLYFYINKQKVWNFTVVHRVAHGWVHENVVPPCSILTP